MLNLSSFERENADLFFSLLPLFLQNNGFTIKGLRER
jgi:hypothetical protein